MKLWTFLPEWRYKQLCTDGEIVGHRLWEYADHAPMWASDTWIVEQMKARGLACPGGYPIWAWHTWRRSKGQVPPPFFRRSREPSIVWRVEYVVPDNEAILFQEDMFVHAACGAALIADDAEDRFFMNLDVEDETTKRMIRATWKRALDLDWGDPARWQPFANRSIGAWVDRIRLTDVVNATSRRCGRWYFAYR